jgi:hypothetical protein
MCKAMSHSAVLVSLRHFGSTTGSPEEIEVDLVAIDVDGAAATIIMAPGYGMPVVCWLPRGCAAQRWPARKRFAWHAFTMRKIRIISRPRDGSIIQPGYANLRPKEAVVGAELR